MVLKNKKVLTIGFISSLFLAPVARFLPLPESLIYSILVFFFGLFFLFVIWRNPESVKAEKIANAVILLLLQQIFIFNLILYFG